MFFLKNKKRPIAKAMRRNAPRYHSFSPFSDAPLGQNYPSDLNAVTRMHLLNGRVRHTCSEVIFPRGYSLRARTNRTLSANFLPEKLFVNAFLLLVYHILKILSTVFCDFSNFRPFKQFFNILSSFSTNV
jgi:hypothetical protein